ncbi:hypothetical protein AVEN_31419-1 [Araneus ventricosus]|uniref:Uncharacterized protein n=1 Tax=Araneus ventricosus TaxID=182803 RepID=A0A4Y2EY23_ARAVE|nr:hypothetical protein AVEN_31419-1 [Araneus ventricosus]
MIFIWLWLSKTVSTLKEVSQKLLLTGHTHMEAEGKHDEREREKESKKVALFLPQIVAPILQLEDFLDFPSLKSEEARIERKKTQT